MAKQFSEKYLNYALKKKVFNRYEYKKNVDFAKIMAKALANTLESEPSENLSRFGQLTKQQVFENGKTIKQIVFIPDQTIQKKISSRYKNRIKKSVNARLKLRTITIVSSIVLCIFVCGFGIYKFFGSDIVLSYKNAIVKTRLERDRKNKEKQREYYEKLALQRAEKLEQDRLAEEQKKLQQQLAISNVETTTTTTTIFIANEDIDWTEENIYFTEEKDLFVKVGADIESNLQEGQVKQEIIRYDGKLYNKITYIIIKGDTLWDISFRFLENAYRWPFIHNLNKYIINPDFILPGDPLVIYTEIKDDSKE